MLTPYKNRTLDTSKPVQVYRNLHRQVYSVRQSGKVVGHAPRICLTDCTFHVNPAGHRRMRDSGVKNVHAYIKGMIIPEVSRIMDCHRPTRTIYYDRHEGRFMCCETATHMKKASTVLFDEDQVFDLTDARRG